MADNMSLFVRLGLNLKGFEQGLHKASNRMTAFGKQMTKTGQDLSMKVTAPVVALGALTLKTAGDFEAAMNKVQAISGATGAEFEALKKQARDLGATTQFSATQAADAMTFLSMAGFETNEILGAMPSTLNLAAAAQLDMGSAADIVSNIMAGFNMTTDELSGAVDVLAKQFTTSNTNLSQLGEAMKYVAPVASGLGVSIQESSAAIGALSDAGLQASMAGTGLRRILSTLSQKSDELGISVFDSSGKMKPLADILQDLEGQGLSTARIMEVFGERGGPALMALLSKGSEAIREQTTLLDGAGGTAQKIADTQMKGLNGALKSLRSAFEELQLAIADSGLLDAVTSFAQRLTSVFRNLSDTNPQILNMIVVAAGLAAALGPVLIIVGQMSIGVGALSKALAFLAASPIILAVAGIAALGGAIYATVRGFRQLNNTVDAAAEKQKALANVRKAANREVAGEIDRIKDLTKVAESENASKEDRIKAVKELQKISPKYNNVLKDEKINLENLKKATEDVTDALVKQAMVKAAQTEIERLSGELLNLQSRTEEVGVSFGETLAIMAKNALTFGTALDAAGDMGIEAVENQNQAIQEIQAKIKALKDFIGENKGMFGELFEGGEQKGGDNPAKTLTNSIRQLSKMQSNLSTSVFESGEALIDFGHKMVSTAPMFAAMAEEQKKITEQAYDTAFAYSEFAMPAISGFIDALASGGQNAFVAFIDGIKQVIAQLVKMAAQALIIAGIMTLITGGAAGLTFGQSLMKTFSGVFKGMAGFANGGVPPVGKPSIVGERGPELFVPSTRGTVIPNHMLGGGQVTFRIQGTELVGILNRHSKISSRT